MYIVHICTNQAVSTYFYDKLHETQGALIMHTWVDEMGTYVHCYVTQGIATNSKAIASYGTVQLQLHKLTRCHAFPRMVTRKKLSCATLSSCVSHAMSTHGYTQRAAVCHA